MSNLRQELIKYCEENQLLELITILVNCRQTPALLNLVLDILEEKTYPEVDNHHTPVSAFIDLMMDYDFLKHVNFLFTLTDLDTLDVFWSTIIQQEEDLCIAVNEVVEFYLKHPIECDLDALLVALRYPLEQRPLIWSMLETNLINSGADEAQIIILKTAFWAD